MPDTRDVLVVDDDASLRSLLAELLASELGVRVRGADDGFAAMREVQEQRPSLVLLDLMMPRLDGFELLQWMKRRPDTATVPVLALTASRSGAIDRALERGCCGFILKPFDVDELLDTLRPYLAA